MSGKLSGRRILVTGAASGMGAGIARLFAAEGAALALLDRNGEGVAQVARDLGQPGWTCDVADRAGVGAVVAQAGDRLGGLDGLVNAAGILDITPFVDLDPASWDRMFAVNVTGAFNVVKAALPLLAEGGVLIGVGSLHLPGADGLVALLREAGYTVEPAE